MTDGILMSEREQRIVSYLSLYSGTSRALREKAVGNLNSWGYTDDEITSALRKETERLEARRRVLRSFP